MCPAILPCDPAAPGDLGNSTTLLCVYPLCFFLLLLPFSFFVVHLFVPFFLSEPRFHCVVNEFDSRISSRLAVIVPRYPGQRELKTRRKVNGTPCLPDTELHRSCLRSEIDRSFCPPVGTVFPSGLSVFLFFFSLRFRRVARTGK